MKVWITKYALTAGIEEREAERCSDRMIVVDEPERGGFSIRQHFHVPDWHTSRDAAVAQVRRMIAAKRKSIAKTLANLTKVEAELNAPASSPGVEAPAGRNEQ